MTDRILIVDYGSQVTQLIARRVREDGVYCEIHPCQKVDDAFLGEFKPQAVILSGGPEPVWMSHGDAVTAIPPGFETIAVSEGAPFAAIADEGRRLYGLQFHPE